MSSGQTSLFDLPCSWLHSILSWLRIDSSQHLESLPGSFSFISSLLHSICWWLYSSQLGTSHQRLHTSSWHFFLVYTKNHCTAFYHIKSHSALEHNWALPFTHTKSLHQTLFWPPSSVSRFMCIFCIFYVDDLPQHPCATTHLKIHVIIKRPQDLGHWCIALGYISLSYCLGDPFLGDHQYHHSWHHFHIGPINGYWVHQNSLKGILGKSWSI